MKQKLQLTALLVTVFSILLISCGGNGGGTPSFVLNLSNLGTGSGKIISAPTGIDCGATCSANFTQSTNVVLTAVANGSSSFIAWGGACTGTQTTCTVTMDSAKTVTANFGTAKFNIDLQFLGSGMTAARKAVFQAAAARWADIIVGDLTDIDIPNGEIPANTACGFGEGAIVGKIDDLLIIASIAPIDGKGGILGQAGFVYRRLADNLPIIGCMKFDSEDIADLETNGKLNNVILHEMGHVIGIGSLWTKDNLGLLNNFQPSSGCNGATANFTINPAFTGSNAKNAYAKLGGSGNVPVEDNYGPGTRCAHWDEETFDNELMTGFIENNTSNPLSRLSIAALKDFGYKVDLSQGDSYAIPSCSPNCIRTETDKFVINEIIIEAKYSISADGHVTPWLGY